MSEDKIARNLKKATTVAAIEKLAKSDHRAAATIHLWDRDLWLLNTQGGIVNLETGKLQPHNPDCYMTRIAHASPEGECPMWMKFLSDVTKDDQELIRFLQRVVGYSLTGSVREHALFFFYGTGRNGKGVFLNTLVALLGEYAGVASMEVMMEASGDRHPTELAMLQGKRLVIAQEVDEGNKWAEAKIKTLTGGDPVTARFMRQDFFTFDPQFKLLIAGNHKPAFRNVDEALRARLHLIPFTVTIPKEKRDPDLTEKLKTEWNGILQWAIEGARQYQEIGLSPPKAVTKATAEYFEAEDTFQQWVEDKCELDPNAWETPAMLFNSWKTYAEAARFAVGNQKTFAQRLENIGFKQAPGRKKGRRYMGIKVIQEQMNDWRDEF